MKTKQTPSVQRPKRERIAHVQVRIPVINQIQPAIFERTAVGFDLSKRESVKRSTVLGTDLDNHLVLIPSLFDRDHLCGKRSHPQATLNSSL